MPSSWRGGPRNFRRGMTVPSCGDCNRKILNSRLYFTVQERQEYVAKVLRKRLIMELDKYKGDDMPQYIVHLALRADYALDLVLSREI